MSSNLVEIIQRYGVEYIGRFYSVYRGVVTNNKDDTGMNRLSLYIPSIQNGINVIALPKSTSFGSINYGIKLITPRIGEVVYVEFENGDPFKPLWSYHGWATGETPDDLKDNNSIGLVTPEGNKIYIKDIDGELYIQTNSKVNISILDSDISITLDKDKVTVNDGSNNGVINIDKFRTFVDAVLKDLMMVTSGSNLSQWMATDYKDIEDKKFIH